MEVDSNHRSVSQQIYSLSPLATRESIHKSFLTVIHDIIFNFKIQPLKFHRTSVPRQNSYATILPSDILLIRYPISFRITADALGIATIK